VRVIETPHAHRDAAWIAANPKARAHDLMEAFEDDSIRAVISTIGGDDSIETSEEQQSAHQVRRWLRSYGVMGILDSVAAILIGRPGGHRLPVTAHKDYDDAVLGVVRDEFGLASPIIAGMDFGHTDPFFVLPYGVRAEIDCDARTFSITEPAVA
jgi:muramoyltetrapeptide carboxypeptidase LdcA involved in peptidoglycan recycling